MAATEQSFATGVSFALTDEQKELRALAREFAAKEIRPAAAEHDVHMRHPVEVIAKAHAVGLMNLHIPEAYGEVGTHAGGKTPPSLRARHKAAGGRPGRRGAPRSRSSCRGRRAGRRSSRPGPRGCGRSPAGCPAKRVANVAQCGLGRAARGCLHDLCSEALRAPVCIRIGLGTAQAVVHVESGDAVAQLSKGVVEAGRVGAAGNQAQHLAPRLDQVVPAHVALDPREQLQAGIRARLRLRRGSLRYSSALRIPIAS